MQIVSQGNVLKRRRVKALLATMAFVVCVGSCGKKEKSEPIQAVTGSADTLGTDGLSEEGFSNEAGPSVGQLVLATTFGRRTGDLDQMLKARNIRALVTINPISFFYSHGRPNGKLYEELEQLQRVVNKQFKTGKLKVRISYIPMRPDELGPALSQGVGDFVATDIVITPGRLKLYAFTTPIMRNVKQIVVTGAELAKAKSLDDLAGSDIYVSPLTSFYENLKTLNEKRAEAGKVPLSVKLVDPNLQEDDLVEMVNAGLIPATVAMQHRAELWGQILPNIQVHPDMMIADEGNLGWAMRKDNPQLKKLLDQFMVAHGQGTLFGNTLLRRYLKNTKWVGDSTSAAEMKRFATYVEYFKKYAADYKFDYLMIVAQGYQESGLDQSKKSRGGAVGIMQVIPKYAAAAPINVPDVRRADKNILAAVRMLNNIVTTYFNDPAIDDVNKTLLTFAGYNAGPTRIARLKKKAKEDGLNPNKWFGNVELEVAEEVGEETVLYVDNIYKYYVAYKLATERKLELQKAHAAGS
jgi:membrane-bound lytic murein transglycosylase MltF